jgi:hypothetical protein
MRTSPRHSRSPSRRTGALFGHTEVLTPFLYVSELIGRSIWIQPPIGCNAVDDDRGVPENAEEKIVVMGVEAVDVGVD